ncbi:MAG: porin family protein [Bacteroides sp.]|nr:porin family protein [Bacteroides sp.]
MKKTLIALSLGLLLALPALAQYRGNSGGNNQRQPRNERSFTRWTNYERETYFGLRLGVAVASVNSDDARLDGGSGMAGINLGVVAGIQLAPSTPIFLESGLYYVGKGGKGYQNSKKFTYDLNYLEIPILVKYKCYMENDIAIQPFLGGYLACGVGGKIKNYGDREAESSFSKANFQRFDGGIRLGCGVSYQNLYLELAYDFGLANICHDTFETSRTGCFFATVGVDF